MFIEHDYTCIRCEKTKFKIGKKLTNGVVCNSCSIYFKKPKVCTLCKKEKLDISRRRLENGSLKKICGNCYTKTLSICSSCGYRRKIFSISKSQKPICKICYTEVNRACIKCNKLIPAGYGNICKECNYTNTLDKKTLFLSNSLSKYTNKIFIDYSYWLTKKRGILFASLNIQKYYEYFFILDEIASDIRRLPKYEEILYKLNIQKLKKHKLAITFLDEKNIIKINHSIKTDQENFILIKKYLSDFENNTNEYMLIKEYYEYLLEKLEKGITTVRSIRLSLTPAVKFLKYCNNFRNNTPSNFILEGYLWLYTGQKAAITGFINFLKNEKSIDISIKDIKQPIFQSPTTSKTILKQRLLDLMKLSNITKNKEQLYYRTLIGYIHNIEIPLNVFIDKNNFKIDKNNNKYLLLNKQILFL